MRKLTIITMSLLIYACSPNKSKEITFFDEAIPETYVLKHIPNFTQKGDTIFVNNKKYSGFLFQFLPNSNDTALVEGYQNGLQAGVTKKWYSNKILMEERHYSKGKKNGKQVAFWENGNKKFEFTAKNDAYEGEMKEWNSDGKLIHLANYKNGQEEGTQKLWYDNGKIRANYVIMKGKRYGLLGTKNCRNVSDSIFVVR